MLIQKYLLIQISTVQIALALNFNMINTTRQTKFATQNTNRRRFGMNMILNRFSSLKGKIPLEAKFELEHI